MQIIDLCSGIGGFSLAGHSLGWETILFCEKEPFPRAVLKDKFPGIPVFEDVFKLTKKDIDGLIQPNRPVIQLCGWPCQPFSVAGARQGTEDSRHLWPEMYRLIREIRPDYVIGENVPGLLNIEGGVVFEQVCLDLESEGYEVQAFVLPACATGAPHRRDRVWIVAYSNEVRRGSGFRSISEANGEISEWHENAESCNAGAGNDANAQEIRCGRGSNTDSNSEEREVCEDFTDNRNGVRGESEGCGGSSQNSGSSGCLDGEYEQQGSFGEFGESGTGSHERNPDGEDAGVVTDTESGGRGMLRNESEATGAREGNQLLGSELAVSLNADTSIQGHQGSEQPRTHGERPEPGEPYRPVTELHSGNYWANWPSISPFHTGYDGIPPDLVRHIRTSLAEVGQTPEQIEAYLRKESNWLRKEAIKCAGNAIVPQVVLEIMKAIESHYNQINTPCKTK